MLRPVVGLISVLCGGLCGCTMYAPAVIVEPTARELTELSAVIAEALHTDHVVVADDALTTASSLVIERAPAKDPQGLLLNGRDLSKPEIFDLYLIRSACVLVHPATHERWILRSVKCRRADDAPRPG